MNPFTKQLARRRLINMFWLLLAVGLLATVKTLAERGLYTTEFLTGWVLFAAIVGLTAFSLRKRLPFLPLGNAALWMQLHIYLGFFSIAAYWIHSGSSSTHGYFDVVLESLFLLVAVSGIVGLILSRVLPQRLTRRGENLLYERLAGFNARLRREVEELVLRAGAEHGSIAIPEFYNHWLGPFFLQPRNFWSHVLESRAPLHRLSEKITALERYLGDGEQAIMQEIIQRVETKNELDYQYAAQSLLKRWLFVHIPLTYGLLLLVTVHAVLVYAFDGSN